MFFTQAENFLIVQDGINAALIIEGTTGRNADPDENEVVTGTIMSYGHGRLFVKTGPRTFKAGDIISRAIVSLF